MRRILLILTICFISCSTEDDEVPLETNEEFWSVGVIPECIRYDSNDITTYCISQSTYNIIYMRIRNLDSGESCLWIDDLTDLNNNNIQGFVVGLSKSRGTCVSDKQ